MSTSDGICEQVPFLFVFCKKKKQTNNKKKSLDCTRKSLSCCSPTRTSNKSIEALNEKSLLHFKAHFPRVMFMCTLSRHRRLNKLIYMFLCWCRKCPKDQIFTGKKKKKKSMKKKKRMDNIILKCIQKKNTNKKKGETHPNWTAHWHCYWHSSI